MHIPLTEQKASDAKTRNKNHEEKTFKINRDDFFLPVGSANIFTKYIVHNFSLLKIGLAAKALCSKTIKRL